MSEAGDGLDHLRIPFEKIKFGKKVEVEGYGTVFEGEFDDQRVALKQLNITNLANIKPKLLAEILTISRFRQHPNLVALLGFCDEKTNEIILVYEYVASGNLADKMRKRLTTIQRLEICLGAARGLDYLHTGVDPNTPGIVHSNIKPSKILLNSDAENSSKFVAKVSSFGLSKIVPGKGTVESSDEVTEKPTKESDVCSLGVLLLEVLCGVSELVDTDDYQERHVTELVPKKMQQNKLRKVVHLDIRKEIKTESLETYAKIACQCVTENPEERPQMAQVVEELEKALRLQGGVVTCVEIPASRSIVGESIHGDKSEDVNIQEDVKDLIAGVGFDDDGEDNGEKKTVEDTRTENITSIEDTKTESSNNDQETENYLNNLNSKRELNITVEKEEENTIPIKNADKEISTNDPETTKEPIDDFDSDNKSKIIDVEENKEDDESTESTTTSESSNDDTSTSTNQDVEYENGDNINGPESTDDITVDLKANKGSNIVVGNEVNNESNVTSLKSNINGDDNNLATGGKVSDAQLLSSNNENGLPEVPVGEDGQEGDNNDEMMNSNTTEEESKESAPNKTNIEGTKSESSNNDAEADGENLKDLNSKRELNITVKNEDGNTSNIPFNDPEITEEPVDDFDSNKKSQIIEEHKEDDERMKRTTTSESSNGDTSTSINQELQDSRILKSERGDFSEVVEDELEHLRIPFEEIKFGQKIDVRGYGTMFEGEFNHQKVALKRLNITNLGNIKPKLLSAILTISRFRQHPNLVALIGFCDENNKEIVLVYEHVSGGNLADKMSKHLNTIQRLQICLGAARGLEYLHTGIESVDLNPGIIHGDLKLSKILLNSDSVSSEFKAKVSGFGLPKLLPGHVEIAPRSMDPVHAATGQLTKESDVHTFGVLLLEVLCGVPELVDTDDYHERHVTELVPKRLEQNMLRKIVHFDIRDEITTESLETYAKITCRCVLKNPEERPTMTEVVEELEKALRLQGGKLSDVQIFGSSNGNVLPEVPVCEDDHEGLDNGVTSNLNATEEESKLGQSFSVLDSGSNDVESVPDVAEKENGDNLNDSESVEKITVTDKSNEELKIMGENEVNNESKTVTLASESDSGNESNSVVGEKVSDAQLLASSNGSNEPEVTEEESKEDVEQKTGDNTNVHESVKEINLKSNEESMINKENEFNTESKITASSSNSTTQEHAFPLPDENDNVLMKNTHNPHTEEIIEAQSSTIPDDNAKAELLNIEKSVLNINTREDFTNSATQTQKSESKRSDSTCSSTGDDTTPSDHLLPKSPHNVKKTSRGSRTCSCCCCSVWQFISDRVVLYGGQFWNKLVLFFTWITGQCSSKRD